MWHNRSEPPSLKPVVWLGDSLRALKSFPSAVQDEVGYALFLAQRGEKHLAAKPMVYLVRFVDRVYVLHAFQKKAKHGVATPQTEIDLIKRRLKQAVAISEGRE
jgi:phage-related protein